MECAHRSGATPSIPEKEVQIINFLKRDALLSGNEVQLWRKGARKCMTNYVWPPIIIIIIVIIIELVD